MAGHRLWDRHGLKRVRLRRATETRLVYTESQMAGTPTEHIAYFKKKEEQLQATRPGTHDVVLRATGLLHPAFSDIPLLFAGQDGCPPTEIVLQTNSGSGRPGSN